MSGETRVEIEGLEEALAKFSPELYSEPLRDFWEKAALTVENEARTRAPVDTGRLRSSLAHMVDTASPPVWAKVGSNVAYAPYMEYGTGLLSDGEGGSGRAHWPPAAALDVWARRHGFANGAQVARIIGRRGGLEPRRFLRGAFEASLGKISQLVTGLQQKIAERWSSGQNA